MDKMLELFLYRNVEVAPNRGRPGCGVEPRGLISKRRRCIKNSIDAKRKLGPCHPLTPAPVCSLGFWSNRFFSDNSFSLLVVARFRCFRCHFRGLSELVRSLPIDRCPTTDGVDLRESGGRYKLW